MCMNNFIKVYFEDNYYKPYDDGDSDCSFTLYISTRTATKDYIVRLLDAVGYYDDVNERDYDGCYEEWVEEKLEDAGITFIRNSNPDLTIRW